MLESKKKTNCKTVLQPQTPTQQDHPSSSPPSPSSDQSCFSVPETECDEIENYVQHSSPGDPFEGMDSPATPDVGDDSFAGNSPKENGSSNTTTSAHSTDNFVGVVSPGDPFSGSDYYDVDQPYIFVTQNSPARISDIEEHAEMNVSPEDPFSDFDCYDIDKSYIFVTQKYPVSSSVPKEHAEIDVPLGHPSSGSNSSVVDNSFD